MLFASTSWAQTSDKSTLNIEEQRFHRRAVEAAYWGMPTVNIWAMREGLKRDIGAGGSDLTYQLLAGLNWQFTKMFSAKFGYLFYCRVNSNLR